MTGLLLLVPVLIGLLAWGSFDIRLGMYVRTQNRGPKNSKTVYLSFDDGPDPVNTPKILHILNQNNAHALFFCIGEKAETRPDLLKQISGQGHIPGNHSWFHRNDFPLQKSGIIRSELDRTRALIHKITGKDTRLFRPPFGVTNPLIAKAVRNSDYQVIGWTIRSFDLSRRSSAQILTRITRKLKNGAIILLHDTSPHSETLLPELFRHLHNHGWNVGEPSDLCTTEKR